MKTIVQQDQNLFRLPDGRHISYAVYGNSQGKPVFFFHGIPGSRLQRNPDLSIFEELPILIYALDRPGYGDSDFQPGRRLLDLPDDLLAFARGNRIEQFAVVGVSGGGPYALACARKIPENLTKAIIISSLAPLQTQTLAAFPPGARLLFSSAKNTPLLLRFVFNLFFKTFKIPISTAFQKFMTELPPADKALFSRPEIQRLFKDDVAQAFRQGTRGVVADISILSQPWGFCLQDIQSPVEIWHGVEDTIVPIQLAHFNAHLIPCAQTHFIEAEGHFMGIQRSKQIFEQIV
ncbi:MAG TPA: alpha/beta hydrolase [bacterium]|nr:alpha/beta hydrolase [bacterium]